MDSTWLGIHINSQVFVILQNRVIKVHHSLTMQSFFYIVQAAEIAKVKEEAEIELNTAKPALDAALSALNSIASKDLVALKALRNPPDVIKRILDCVLILRYRSTTISG